MASLLKILAASVGSGIVLGAGIRLGETIATRIPVPESEAGSRLARRLEAVETRLTALTPRDETVESATTTQMVREDLRTWLDATVAERMAEVETRLQSESARGQKEILDTFAEGVETRVIHRISRLEEEVASQSAAMNELRECSLRTEKSVQKLLGGLDRLIAPKTEEQHRVAVPLPTPPSLSAEEAERPRRWKLFG
jgi:uncharacterized coiled-coil protein SlyX